MENGGTTTATGIASTITAIVGDIWDLVGSFIEFANTNTVVWIPIGFTIARATVSLFRKAISFGGRRR